MFVVHAERMKRTAVVGAIVVLGCVAGACAQGSDGVRSDRPIGPEHLVASDFVTTVDHRYFPLEPGTVWEYEADNPDGDERIVVTVLDDAKVIDGVTAVVVLNRTSDFDGNLLEETYDWYAQDKIGNVWYLGEDTKNFEEEGSTDGSWEAGVDGARAGLIMVAKPRVGKTYQQEFYAGTAEDVGKILSIDDVLTVPTGRYENVLRTADVTALEPELIENKWYAPGVGLIQEADLDDDGEKVVLTKLSRPRG